MMPPSCALAAALLAHALSSVAYATANGAAPGSRPHILMVLLDDFGWGDSGWHRTGSQEVVTPRMDRLVREGLELDRHYAFKVCSPSRSAFQSGREPIHVNVELIEPTFHNPADPVSGYSGIPRNMTGIAALLKRGGYRTHMAGKWDVGMATPDHTPAGRGYDTSLLYFHFENDYWTSRAGTTNITGAKPGGTFRWGGSCRTPSGEVPIDLWDGDSPAWSRSQTAECAVGDGIEGLNEKDLPCWPGWPAAQKPGCTFEDDLFYERMLETIRTHPPEVPLFLFWAPHAVHTPLQLPEYWAQKFTFIDDWKRARYLATVHYIDSAIGNITDLLVAKGMYNNTLVVVASDNGGPIYDLGSSGANNWPLRGGKFSNWDGGVRVNAFASGGAIPLHRRGLKLDGLMALWDWYATFAALAGVDSTDHRAAAAKLPPVDGLDLWPYLSGTISTSPRREVALGSTVCDASTAHKSGCGTMSLPAVVNGIISDEGPNGGLWKLLIGLVAMDMWQGPQYPNATTAVQPPGERRIHNCGTKGCLFRLDVDPTELMDLADVHLERVARLGAAIVQHNKTTFSPDRGDVDPAACDAVFHRYGGFWGPWIDVDSDRVTMV